MEIAAILPQSLIDYPNKICSVFFTLGCNFRCPYCYNVDLVLRKIKPLPEEKIFSFLEERKNFLDAILLSGGEPTLQKDLVSFAEKVKSFNYLFAIETNGSRPEVIRELIDKKLLDFIAMDIKADLENYEKTVRTNIDIKKIKKSIELIKGSGIEYEFRTTVVPTLFDEKIAENIGKMLKGAKVYVLQHFLNNKDMLDNSFKKIKPFSDNEIEKFKKILEKSVERVLIR